MSERRNAVIALLGLGWRNAWRWRWRLMTIAVLISLSVVLYLVYSGLIADLTAEGEARIQPLETPYYDMLVQLGEGEEFFEPEMLPQPAGRREIVASSEGAMLLKMSGSFGNLRLLGLQSESGYFRIEPQDLQGRMAIAQGELVVPLSWAEAYGVDLGESFVFTLPTSLQAEGVTLEAHVVGFYRDHVKLPIALTTLETLLDLVPQKVMNVWLVTLNRTEATLEHLEDYAERLYPGSMRISAELPARLGKTMLNQAYQPGAFVLVSIFFFMGIGVLTIALMTFLERRKELATLKAVGITKKLTVVLFGFEYSLSGVLGMGLTVTVFSLLMGRVSWFRQIEPSQLYQMLIHGVFIAMFVLILALVYPIAIARAATVDQLQFARNIPLRVTRLDHLENPTGAIIVRELTENVRLMRIPFEIDRYTCMVFKRVGDPVKKGEVIASEERYQGHVINNFLAPCDGVVCELNGANVSIAPNDPEEPFYPYPSQLATEHRHSIEVFEQARQRERAKIEQEKLKKQK